MKNIFIKIFTVVAFLGMVVVNFLANSLPINNRSTGMISDAYPNLFAPAGYTFSIWGFIYLLLACYSIYQLGLFGKKFSKKKEKFVSKINILFIATSIANISWIFAWHYDIIWLSVIIMAALLILLIKLADIFRVQKLTSKEGLFMAVPFSVYFGWITVASIANITVFLVSMGWSGFGIEEFVWTSIVLLIGSAIGILRLLKDKKVTYGLVLIWAYLGILFKHLSSSGFNGQYPIIITTVMICVVLFVFFVVRLIYKKYFMKHKEK